MAPPSRPLVPASEASAFAAPPLSEETFRWLVTRIENCAIFMLTADGIIATWNAGAVRIFGYGEEDMVGRPFARCFPATDVEAGEPERILDRTRTDGPCTLVSRLLRNDGACFWAALDLSPLHDAAGDMLSYAVVLRDITDERVAAEESLRAQARLRSLLNTVPGYILTLKPDGTITYINRTYPDFSTEALLGRNVIDWVPEEDREAFRAALRRVVATGKTVELETRGPGPNRQTAVFLTRIGPVLRDGEVESLTMVATDITRHKEAQTTLQAREAYLRAVVDTAVEGIISIDEQGIIQSFNCAAERIFGYRADEIIGRNVNVLMPSPYREEHDDYIRNYLTTGRKKIIGIGREATGLRKDGSLFPLELSVSEFRYADQRMFAGIVRDITERKELERYLAEAASAEQQRIAQDLHDGLGGQMGGIAILASFLHRQLSAAGSPQAELAAELVEHIQEAGQQLRDVAHGLLPVEVSASGLMLALERLAEHTDRADHLTCTFTCDGHVDLLDNTVATHLYRIAQEAVHNAIRHGKARHIDIALTHDGPSVTLTVTDDGVGIPDDAIKRGGMGLRTIRYRAGVIGARLDIHRNGDHGTTVACTLSTG
ncbi:PAS domain S-box protein [Rhodocaloribacter sp.]